MAIRDELNRITTNINQTYDVLKKKGASIPDVKNSYNLINAAQSIDVRQLQPIYTITLYKNLWDTEDSQIYTQIVSEFTTEPSYKIDVALNTQTLSKLITDGVQCIRTDNQDGTIIAICIGGKPTFDFDAQLSIDNMPGSQGRSPIRGVDYWTQSDKQDILDEVLSKVPSKESTYTKLESDTRYIPIKASIKPTASGERINLTDSIEYPIQRLKIFGKTTQDGIPTPDAPVALTSSGDKGSIKVAFMGANLLKYPYASGSKFSKNGFEYTQNEDGSVSYFGSKESDSAYYMLVNEYCPRYIRNMFQNQMLNVYRYGSYKNGMRIQIYSSSQTPDRTKDLGDGATYHFDNLKGLYNVVLGPDDVYGAVSIPESIIYPMLSIGTVKYPYEKYKEQILTVATENSLRGIPVSSGGNYTDEQANQYWSDYIDFVTGKYVQNVGKIDSYNGEAVGDVWISTTGQLTTGATVLYKLDTPVESKITEETMQAYQSLFLYDSVTNITTDSSPAAGLEVKYVANIQKYIDNKLAAITNAIIGGI